MFVCFAPAFCGGFFCAICKAIKKIIRNIFCQLEIFIYICINIKTKNNEKHNSQTNY